MEGKNIPNDPNSYNLINKVGAELSKNDISTELCEDIGFCKQNQKSIENNTTNSSSSYEEWKAHKRKARASEVKNKNTIIDEEHIKQRNKRLEELGIPVQDFLDSIHYPDNEDVFTYDEIENINLDAMEKSFAGFNKKNIKIKGANNPGGTDTDTSINPYEFNNNANKILDYIIEHHEYSTDKLNEAIELFNIAKAHRNMSTFQLSLSCKKIAEVYEIANDINNALLYYKKGLEYNSKLPVKTKIKNLEKYNNKQ